MITANALDLQRGGPDDNSAQANHLVPGDSVTAKCLTTSQERQDYDTQDFIAGNGVRRLTPVECERLQGFPDGFSIPDETPWQEHPTPDGPRYAQMGNAVTVPVIEWIGHRIKEYGLGQEA